MYKFIFNNLSYYNIIINFTCKYIYRFRIKFVKKECITHNKISLIGTIITKRSK